MTEAPVWPDRSTYRSMVSRPADFIGDDELSGAVFATDRSGQPKAWSGGRAIVFRAECASGPAAVRFLLSDDRTAAERYAALTAHLAGRPVESLVRTQWLADGLRFGGAAYPLIKMEWVEGESLDRHVRQVIDTSTAGRTMGRLTTAWQLCCRALVDAGIGHGDIHAGNLLVSADAAGRYRLRLVDYDNMWVPGLTLTSREAGHPSFQHPTRPAEQTGRYMDAFPNTLTYLSLRATAIEPGLWTRFALSDDALLFSSIDLADAGRDVWAALASSPDAVVRATAALTVRWMTGAHQQYESLDQVLAAAESAQVSAPRPVNTWPMSGAGPALRPPGPPVPPAAWPGNPFSTQRWPTSTPVPPIVPGPPVARVAPVPPGPPVPSARATGTAGRTALLVLAALVILIWVIAALV